MGQEINLLDRYPRSKRPIEARSKVVTEEARAVSRRFGPEFFDGDRMFGYGGYRYHPRFWTDTIQRFHDYYHLKPDASVLDVGCAKGFMLYDFKRLIPEIRIAGIDVSSYAIGEAPQEVRPFLRVGSADALPYPDRSFDLVISINTVHNLPLEQCKQAIQEIQRVARMGAFLTVDAWRDEDERKRMEQWNVTALTYMHVNDWKRLFAAVGYTGDYYWFLPE